MKSKIDNGCVEESEFTMQDLKWKMFVKNGEFVSVCYFVALEPHYGHYRSFK